MNAGHPDLRPFRERVLEVIDLKQPGSGSLSGHDVLCFLRERIGSWVDERLRLYERTSAEVEELRADRVKLQGEIERLSHELAEGDTPLFWVRNDPGLKEVRRGAASLPE